MAKVKNWRLKMMDDNSIMPWGKYKGYKLANVPAWYLLWLADEKNIVGHLKNYIEENRDILEQEKRDEQNNNNG